MGKTKHTAFRLSDSVRSMLKTLAAVDGTTATAIVCRLIRAEYTARKKDIAAFRKAEKLIEKG